MSSIFFKDLFPHNRHERKFVPLFGNLTYWLENFHNKVGFDSGKTDRFFTRGAITIYHIEFSFEKTVGFL